VLLFPGGWRCFWLVLCFWSCPDQDRNKRYSVSANCLLHTATGQPFPARAERCCPGVVATMYLQVFPATFPATFPAVLA